MEEHPIRDELTAYGQPSICEETTAERDQMLRSCLRFVLEACPTVKRLLSIALIATAVLGGSGAMACEKHLNGHQNSSDTNAEGIQK